MASQSFGSAPARDASMNSKVAVGDSKQKMGTNVRQPMVGKQTVNGGESMPGSKGKGQAVKNVPSNPISGAKSAQPGNTAMGSGDLIKGFV
jgi:hypothetical protein